MAHHAVPALIHTHAVRPTVVSGQGQPGRARPPEGVSTNTQTDADPAAKTVSMGQRSLWCCSFLIMPLLIPMLIYVKDSDVLRRIFLGLFTALILVKLICFSIAIFHTRTHQAMIARRNSDDDRFSRRAFPPPTRLLHAPVQQTTHMRPIPTFTRLTPTPHTSRISCNQNGVLVGGRNSSSADQFTLDDPPPYHLALTLPLPQEEHTINIRETAETPPPDYEKVLA